jgi:hypothetical protein
LRLEKLVAPVKLHLSMRFTSACLSLLALGGATTLASPAFKALQLLPPEQVQNVAVIAGRDGTPEPERWHILVHDPKVEGGVREFVIAGSHKTADRPVSQFAETLTAGDVMSPDALKVDSDQVARVAMQFGVANNKPVAAMHFDLRKSGAEASPLWTVTCLDTSGAELGKIIVSAARGTVIMHPGFTQEPQIDPLMAAARTTPVPVGDEESTRSSSSSKKNTTRRRLPPPPPAPTPRPNLFQRMFGGPH